MIYTHIFLVILVTVVLIIFAEYQNLRKISWILFIGCVTYILLMIDPETTQQTNNEYDEYTNIDSTILANTIGKELEPDKVVENFIKETENVTTIITDESEIIDEIQNLDVLTLAIATDVVEKKPIGVSRLFLNDINALYCFTVVDNKLKNNKIIHNWKRYEEDYTYEQDYFKSIIRIGDSPNWRCWSRITIRPEMAGDWQVVVTDTVGNYLDSIEFSIIPTSE